MVPAKFKISLYFLTEISLWWNIRLGPEVVTSNIFFGTKFSHQNVWLEKKIPYLREPKCCKFDEIPQFYKLDKADNTWNTFWEKCSYKIAAKLQNYFFPWKVNYSPITKKCITGNKSIKWW